MKHRNIHGIFTGAMLAAAAAAMWGLHGEVITDTTGYSVFTAGIEAGGQSGFTRPEDWSGGELSDQVDYLIRSNYRMRTPENVADGVFPGKSLTLDNGRILCKGANEGRIYFGDLRLHKCIIANGNGGSTQHLCGTFTIFGDETPSAFTVTSAAGNRTLTMHAKLVGSQSSVLTVGNQGTDYNESDEHGDGTGTFLVASDADTSKFYGRYVVDGRSEEKIKLQAESISALGLKEASAEPFVTLRNGAELFTVASMNLDGATVKIDGAGRLSTTGQFSATSGASVLGSSGQDTLEIVATVAPHTAIDGMTVQDVETLSITCRSLTIGEDFSAQGTAVHVYASGTVTVNAPKSAYGSITLHKQPLPVMTESLDNDEYGFTAAGGWKDQDGNAAISGPTADCDYVVPSGTRLRATADAVFGGNSLTVKDGGDLAVKNARVTVNDFRMEARGRITTRGDERPNAIFGTGTLSGCGDMRDPANAFFIEIETDGNPRRARSLEFGVALSGTGLVCPRWFEEHKESATLEPETRITLSGDNSHYTGKWFLASPCVRTVFAAQDAIGGDSALVADKVQFKDGGRLFVPDDLTVPATAGLQVRLDSDESSGVGVIEVSEGKTLTVNSPLSGNGRFVKEGAGTLVLGSAAENFNEDRAQLLLNGGRATFRNSEALGTNGGRIKVGANGMTVRISGADGLKMRAGGLSWEGGVEGALAVEIDEFETAETPRAEIPLFLFTGADSVDSVPVSRIAVSGRRRGYVASVEAKTIETGVLVYARVRKVGLVVFAR